MVKIICVCGAGHNFMKIAPLMWGFKKNDEPRRVCMGRRKGTEQPVTITEGTNRLVHIGTEDIFRHYNEIKAANFEAKWKSGNFRMEKRQKELQKTFVRKDTF